MGLKTKAILMDITSIKISLFNLPLKSNSWHNKLTGAKYFQLVNIKGASFYSELGNTGETLPHLSEVYHLTSCTGTNAADHMVQLPRVRECCSGVANAE